MKTIKVIVVNIHLINEALKGNTTKIIKKYFQWIKVAATQWGPLAMAPYARGQ